jgi:hypothetical protein
MARTGIDLGNSQLQVGARLKKGAFLLLLLFLASSLSSIDGASAATKKPTPKPTTKVTAKATAKASPVKTAKAKPKPKPRKKVKVAPSPSPKWPPAGFTFEAGVYARVPSSKQLVSIISAKRYLASQVKSCTKFVCGAVQVAAEPGCQWWEVNSNVYSEEKVLLGNLKTIVGDTLPFEIKTILLISPEPIETREFITDIEVVCNQDPKPEGVAKSTYTKLVEPTPPVIVSE